MIASKQTEAAKKDPFKSVFGPLLFLTTIFFLNFTTRVIISPLLPEIESTFSISHTESGSLFLFMTLGYFVSITASGLVSSIITSKYTIVLSTILSGIFVSCLGIYENIYMMRVGLFFLGLGAGLYLPSGLATIAHIVPSSHIGRGMAIHEFAPNLGFVTTPFLCTLLISVTTWQNGLVFVGAILIFTGFLYAFKGIEGEYQGEKMSSKAFIQIFKNRQFVIVTLIFSFAICSTLGIYSLLPLYLVVSQGMDLVESNQLVGVSRILAVFMPFVGGLAGDRIGHRKVMLLTLFLSGLLTIPIGLFSGTLLIIIVVIQPIIAVCFFPSVFAHLAETSGRNDVGLMVSVCVPVAFLFGAGVLPTFMGFIGDYFGLGVSFVVVGVMMSITSLIASIVWRSE